MATHTFTGATKTAAETARDTYATANADWLESYDDNADHAIQLTNTGGTTTFAWQVSRSMAWVDVAASLIKGEKGDKGDMGDTGPAGMDGDITGVTAGTNLTGGGTTGTVTINGPTDTQIGDKAFSNPPTLTTSEQGAVRTAIGAGDGDITGVTAGTNLTGGGTSGTVTVNGPSDTEIGDKAFSNPPSNLTTSEQTAVRTAIGAGTGGGGTDLTDTEIGDKAFSNPPLRPH